MVDLAAQWSLLLWISTIIGILYALILRGRRHPRLPPGPRPLPIIGNLLALGLNPHRSLARLAKYHGPLMTLKLGQATALIVTSPNAAREILNKHDQAFSSRPVPDAVCVLGHHEASLVWQPAGKSWKNLRKICSTQLFNSQRLNDNRALRQQKVRELVEYVRDRCVAGDLVDVGRAAHTVVLNVISNMLFSIDMGDYSGASGPDGRGFREMVWEILEEAGKPNLSDYFPLLAAVDLQGRRRRMAYHTRNLYEVFDELIEKRMQDRIEQAGNDLLDSLIEWNSMDADTKINRRAIKSLLGDLFVAGTDTTSSTIEWAMAEFLHNPSTMEKARSELVEIIGKEREVDESDIPRLPYLQAVIKEVLRLHPSVPFLVPHMADTNVELCGYTIPEGTRVLVNVWAMGRDGHVWTDPEVFMPERFLEKDLDYKGRDFELIPFGAGRRICPGISLASRIMPMVLASLILHFNWKLPEGMKAVDMTEKFGFTLAKATPLFAIPILRKVLIVHVVLIHLYCSGDVIILNDP